MRPLTALVEALLSFSVAREARKRNNYYGLERQMSIIRNRLASCDFYLLPSLSLYPMQFTESVAKKTYLTKSQKANAVRKKKLLEHTNAYRDLAFLFLL